MTPLELILELQDLANRMSTTALHLHDAGTDELTKHAVELRGAAGIVSGWADALELECYNGS